MRILVTGATGFVGGWLGVELARAHAEAEIFGTHYGPPGPPLPEGFPASARLLPCDLTEPGAAAAIVGQTRPDRVFHLAGFASAAGGDAALIRRANVEATVEILRALEAQGRPCRVLLASSGYVYGSTEPGRPAREEDPLDPRGVYAESKAAMETAVQPFAGRGGGLALTVTRAFNHTGPRQSADFVVPAFARQIARIERGLDPPVVRVGNLLALRDFLDVRDVVRAYRMLLDHEDGSDWRIVNVASGAPVSIQALLDDLQARARAPLSVEPDPARMRPADLPESAGDPARLRALTGWRQEIDLPGMLAETLDWWREQAAL